MTEFDVMRKQPEVYCHPCDLPMPCKCQCDTCQIRLERLESYLIVEDKNA